MKKYLSTSFLLVGTAFVAIAGYVLVSSMLGYQNHTDKDLVLPLFIGTAFSFVGFYFEAKHEPTYGIAFYEHNRRTKMRTSIGGCLLSLVTIGLILYAL